MRAADARGRAWKSRALHRLKGGPVERCVARALRKADTGKLPIGAHLQAQLHCAVGTGTGAALLALNGRADLPAPFRKQTGAVGCAALGLCAAFAALALAALPGGELRAWCCRLGLLWGRGGALRVRPLAGARGWSVFRGCK